MTKNRIAPQITWSRDMVTLHTASSAKELWKLLYVLLFGSYPLLPTKVVINTKQNYLHWNVNTHYFWLIISTSKLHWIGLIKHNLWYNLIIVFDRRNGFQSKFKFIKKMKSLNYYWNNAPSNQTVLKIPMISCQRQLTNDTGIDAISDWVIL